MTLEEIEQLEGLLAKATAGLWLVGERANSVGIYAPLNKKIGSKELVLLCDSHKQRAFDNANFIAYLHNAAPRLLFIARAALAASTPSGGSNGQS